MARDVPVAAAALSAGTVAVADEPFKARWVPVMTADGSALVVVVALVGLAAGAEPVAVAFWPGDAAAGATPVVDNASALTGADEFVAAAPADVGGTPAEAGDPTIISDASVGVVTAPAAGAGPETGAAPARAGGLTAAGVALIAGAGAAAAAPTAAGVGLVWAPADRSTGAGLDIEETGAAGELVAHAGAAGAVDADFAAGGDARNGATVPVGGLGPSGWSTGGASASSGTSSRLPSEEFQVSDEVGLGGAVDGAGARATDSAADTAATSGKTSNSRMSSIAWGESS